MPALPLIIGVLCALAIGYRYYSLFLAKYVVELDDSRVTAAHTLKDGHNFHPTHGGVLFGHHFAAISGAGPLIGPVLAAQFGYLPGLLWLVVGVVLAGAVQDFIVLVASVRKNGRSLAEMIRDEMGPAAGFAAGLGVLFVLIIALAGLGIVVVNALSESAWGTFTIAMTIPIALFMSAYMYGFRKGKVAEATWIGAGLLLLAVWGGRWVAESPYASWFLLSRGQITLAMAVYGFTASVLPVWVLLCPRDYLSSFLKIGTIALLVIGVVIVNPELKMPAVTEFVHGGGPILSGKVFPYVFITIMCGAVSGFHALVASGTTPKMIGKESHCRPIGYGAMLIEGLVGVVALVAVASLHPGDYFAINVAPAKFENLKLMGYHIEELPVLEAEVKENVTGRTGGAVSLAVGMAKIFSSLPGLKGWLAYWYHFAIMFEALFILTTIDTGTRIARFVLQEYLGKIHEPLGRPHHWGGTILTSFLTVAAWGYFIYTGSVATIWPMFGIANQLLAVMALWFGTVWLISEGKRKYAWVTFVPMLFVFITTTSGAWSLVADQFVPLLSAPSATERVRGTIDIALTALIFGCFAVVLAQGLARVKQLLKLSN